MSKSKYQENYHNMAEEIIEKELWDHYSELPNPAWYEYKNKLNKNMDKLDIIKEIAQGRLRWTSCSDQDGNTWKEPYIKCDNEGHGKSFVNKLAEKGIESVVDLYEDDDGDGDYGRPIIRKIWSVRIKNS